MTAETDEMGRLDGLLSRFAERVPGVEQAVLASADGSLLGAPAQTAPERADLVATITSELVTFSQRAADLMGGGPVNQTMVEMTDGLLLSVSVSGDSFLAVLADPSCDIGVVGYEMGQVAGQVGPAPAR